MKKPCTVPGCTKPLAAGGMCFMHYSRVKRSGTTELEPRPPKGPLTLSRLLEVVAYDKDTGEFTWVDGRWKKNRIGGLAGTICKQSGYLKIQVDGKTYLAHRLAWLYVTGAWPQHTVDHKNRDRTDNRFNNLRDVSVKTNCENRSVESENSSSGFLGVSVSDHGGRSLPFKASILHNGKRLYIGRFATAEEAAAAYFGAKKVIHKGFTL